MKKVIIFGATGNVGSYFTKYASENLDAKEYQIVPTGRRTGVSVFDRMGGGGRISSVYFH